MLKLCSAIKAFIKSHQKSITWLESKNGCITFRGKNPHGRQNSLFTTPRVFKSLASVTKNGSVGTQFKILDSTSKILDNTSSVLPLVNSTTINNYCNLLQSNSDVVDLGHQMDSLSILGCKLCR